jgi:hypothetical protein
MYNAQIGDQVTAPVRGGRTTGSVIAVDGAQAQVAWTPGFRISWCKITRLTLVTRLDGK